MTFKVFNLIELRESDSKLINNVFINIFSLPALSEYRESSRCAVDCETLKATRAFN